MTTQLLQAHPIVACARSLREQVAEVREVQPVYMPTADKESALTELIAVEAQVAELRLRIMASAGDVADAHGDRDVATWLSGQTQAEPAATRADLELGRELDGRCPQVAAGMAEGTVSAAHARVITRAVGDLPEHVGPDTRERAEATLVEYAAQFRPSQLRRIGRRILEVVAPEIAEAAEAQQLADQERRAREKASLRFHPLGDGTTRITGLLPDPMAARLRTYLEAYTSPRHRSEETAHQAQATAAGFATDQARPTAAGSANTDPAPQHRKYAHAFAALLEHLDPKNLPEHGGDATTVMVTVDLDALRAELATAGLIDADLTAGANLTAAEARRLACTAQIVPVVLGGESETLDLGRSRRLFTPAQRRALRLRDQTCRAEDCTVPATWTEAHHLTPWADGGPTDLDNALSLCNHHHHRIHDQTYQADRLPDGDIRFHRRV